jgi:hypothetical protein
MNTPQKVNLKIAALLTAMIIGLTICYAQSNYDAAIFEARHTDLTDFEIEKAMYKRGFIVDAYGMQEPTMIEKIVALAR